MIFLRQMDGNIEPRTENQFGNLIILEILENSVRYQNSKISVHRFWYLPWEWMEIISAEINAYCISP